ncbi:hypothetical protein K1719_000256 [Acacia pycnantha]|nr:hypothetical protein K1719_000256 [Acacia pycnantha]
MGASLATVHHLLHHHQPLLFISFILLTFSLLSPSSSSTFTELSPDIAPLLPSPGGVLPTPTAGSDIPTIPSSPSPPNPDGDLTAATGPLSALSPSGPVQPASKAPPALPSSAMAAALAGSLAYCFIIICRV